MTSAHGVESRCPFLDYRLVDWALRLPDSFHLSEDMDEKHLLKRAFAKSVPPVVLTKPKRPYRAPDTTAFLIPKKNGTKFPDYAEEVLSPGALADVGILNVDWCARFLAKLRRSKPGQVSPRENQAFVLLLSVSLLHRLFIKREGLSRSATTPPIKRAVDRVARKL